MFGLIEIGYQFVKYIYTMSDTSANVHLSAEGEYSKIYTMLNTCFDKGKQVTEAGTHYYASPEMVLFLYYLYLTAKYRKICYHKSTKMGIETDISNDLDFREEDHTLEEDIKQFVDNMITCIHQPRTLFVFPLSVQFDETSRHANLLIYRRDNKDFHKATQHSIEHFEPNGASVLRRDEYKDVKDTLEIIIDILREEPGLEHLVYHDNPSVCPVGLQSEEANIPKHLNKPYETGYCGAWSMLLTELVLEHPSMSTKNIVQVIFDTKPEVQRVMPFGVYLRYVMRGYTSMILDKLNKYYKSKLGIGNITFQKIQDYDISDKIYEKMEKLILHASRVGHSKTQLMSKPKFGKLFEQVTPTNSKSKSRSKSPTSKTQKRPRPLKKVTNIPSKTSSPPKQVPSQVLPTTKPKTRRRHRLTTLNI